MPLKIKDDYQKLLKEYRKLAKRADQRLVRLEGYRHDKGFQNITQYAYKKAMSDIRSWSGKGSKRFNTAPPKTAAELKAKISDIKSFLQSPTSSKKQVMKVTKSLNQRFFGKDKKQYLTWEEWANFWERVDSENTDSRFNYNLVAKSAGVMKKYNITRQNIDDKLDVVTRSGDMDIIEARTLKELQKNGLTLDKLIGK